MKAISLWQPWASALFTPLKPDETRHWRIPFGLIGKDIAIHAAKRATPDERFFWESCHQDEKYFQDIGIHSYASFPRGAIIGIVKFVSCLPTEDVTHQRTPIELHYGNYATGRFAWHRHDTTILLPTPIPCIGRQGFFNWESDSLARQRK